MKDGFSATSAPAVRPDRDVTTTGPLTPAAGAAAAPSPAPTAPPAPASTPVRDILAAEPTSAAPFPVAGGLPERPAAEGARGPGTVSSMGSTIGPASADATFDTTTEAGRRALVQGTPQLNAISGSEGPEICGGAGPANALVLDGTTPAKRQQNAAAIRTTAMMRGATIQPGSAEDTALKHMESGQMTSADMAVLQKLMYRLARAGSGPNAPAGVNPSQMTALMSQLRENGGFQGSTVRMHQQAQGNIEGQSTLHWTCEVNGTHADSWPSGTPPRATVTTTAPGVTQQQHPMWNATVESDAAGHVRTSEVAQSGPHAGEVRHYEIDTPHREGTPNPARRLDELASDLGSAQTKSTYSPHTINPKLH